jgi:short-subunit dehydrogenase
MDLTRRVALVTGASSGIGQAVATQLVSRGARVVVHGRDRQRTLDCADRLGARPVVADLARDAGIDELAAAAVDAYGRIDVLVAAAGVGWSGPFAAMAGADIDELVRVDLIAPVRLCHALLPAMIERQTGHVAFVGSIAGRTGVAGEAVYAGAKGGLDLFVDSLRLELAASGVAVSLTVPAAVDTEFFVRRGRPYSRRVPRPVSPQRVATAVVKAIERDRPEAWVPAWLRIAPAVRAIAPGPYRFLSRRFGEQVRAARHDEARLR